MRIFNAVLFGAVAVVWLIPVWRELQMNNYRVPYYHIGEAVDILLEGIAAILIGVLTGLIGNYYPNSVRWVAWAACMVFFLYRLYRYSKERTHVKMTKRMWRLAIPTALLVAGGECAAMLLLPSDGLAQAVGLTALPLFRPIVCLCNCLIRPFELLNNRRYIRVAHQKIMESGAVRIGITGSYGKTGCKNILKTLLSTKYRVIASEGNRNTPLGLVDLANYMEGYQFAIAEMGARREGDIAELVQMFQPAYAIVTGVGEQHLESFHNIETIYRTKKELVDGLPFTGYAVFNGENAFTERMANACAVDHELVGFQSRFGLWATDIRLSGEGTRFTLCGWDDPIEVQTKLLGRHNVLNILLCTAMARKLGVTKEEAVQGIAALQPVPHRLQLVENERQITIIDDSYNANIEGVQAAFEVLEAMQGRKVVFTQGIVELGRKQREINRELGEKLADVADLVLLMGENTAAIREGLSSKGYNGDHIVTFHAMEEAGKFFAAELRPQDVLLIQNDIP